MLCGIDSGVWRYFTRVRNELLEMLTVWSQRSAPEDDVALYENYTVERCQNASKRAYVENTARTFKVLDRCLRSTEILVSATTEMMTVEDDVSSSGLTTTGSTLNTGSTLLPSTTEVTTIGDESDGTSTTTEKSVEPTNDSGATSTLNTNVSYLLLGINILKYTFHSFLPKK